MLKLNLSASFTYSLTPTTSNLVNIESKWFIQLFSPRSNYIRGRWGCMMILRSLFVLGLLIGHKTFLQPIRHAVLYHTIDSASVAESWADTGTLASDTTMDRSKSGKLIFFLSFRYLLQNVEIFSLIHFIIVQINKM